MIKLPYGKEFIEFELPPRWKLLGIFEPQHISATKDIYKKFMDSIYFPIGSKKLQDLCVGKNKIVIVVDDISRPTPIYLFMQHLVELLRSYGVKFDGMTIITALGVHREMSDNEIKSKVGEFAFQNIRCINHNCRDENSLKFIGKTSRGTPVYINKIVAEADLIILVGTIEPHIQAGFGGGFKNILPGVAGLTTIGKNHLLSAVREFSKVGNDPEYTPMRLDIEESACMLNKDFFIVNTILNQKGEIVKFFCGDPIKAHREGIKFAKQIYRVNIPEQADIVISSSHPFDLDLRQGVKGIANTIMAAKKNGLIIGLLRCEQTIGDLNINFTEKIHPFIIMLVKNIVFKNRFIIKLIAQAMSFAIKRLPLKNIPYEMKFFLYIALRAIVRNRVFICAPALPDKLRNIFPDFFTSFEEAIGRAREFYPDFATVAIFPRGGVTYPEQVKT